jgi:hypothetical protein
MLMFENKVYECCCVGIPPIGALTSVARSGILEIAEGSLTAGLGNVGGCSTVVEILYRKPWNSATSPPTSLYSMAMETYDRATIGCEKRQVGTSL